MLPFTKVIESKLEEESLDEKAKYIRFERLSELFTYIAAIAGVFLSVLPYQFPFERTGLYIFIFILLIFLFIWFRVIPKKYSGKTKNLFFYALSILFVGVVVYFTRGVLSPVNFLFYLTCLAVAASMGIKETVAYTSLSTFVIFSLAIIRPEGLTIIQSLSLATLHTWGLVSTVVFGWLVFREEKRFREAGQQTRIDRIKKINKIKDEFLFIISSKLANPVITLREYMTMVLSGKFGSLSPAYKDMLVKTEENSRRLELLVEDMLDLSKIETGSLRLSIEKVNIGDVIGSTLSDFSLKASEKKISLIYDKPKENLFVKADSARLHEVVANLVDNSIKYSPVGSRITIRFLEKGNFIQVVVEDNGYGISEKAQKKIFEKFYRSEDQGERIKGSGLGLFITKQLIDRQGGSIWFDSKLGVGTKFSFKLPKAVNGK